MDLEACLPADLRGATITKIAAGLSGAGVYRVDAGARAYVLKVGAVATELQRRAADAGIAPRVIHVDEARRAVTSELVEDRGFMLRCMAPATRGETIAALGATLRRVHALPLLGERRDPRRMLDEVWRALAGVTMPAFVGDVVARVLAEAAPPCGPDVTSHNDVNPTNLVWDGERVLLLDWDAAGPNDPYFDTATAAVFLRLDDAASAHLLEAAGLAPHPRFAYDRRLVAALCGAMFLRLARDAGHPGGTVDEPLVGRPDPSTPDGRWRFGLSLVKRGA